MRVVVIVVAVIIVIGLVWLLGFGRTGFNSCVEDCREAHCADMAPKSPECRENPEYLKCKAACKKEHRDK